MSSRKKYNFDLFHIFFVFLKYQKDIDKRKEFYLIFDKIHILGERITQLLNREIVVANTGISIMLMAINALYCYIRDNGIECLYVPYKFS